MVLVKSLLHPGSAGTALLSVILFVGLTCTMAVRAESIRLLVNNLPPPQQPALIADVNTIRKGIAELTVSIPSEFSTTFAPAALLTVVPGLRQSEQTTITVYCREENSVAAKAIENGEIQFYVSAGTNARTIVIRISGKDFYSYEDAVVRFVFLRKAFQAPIVATNVPFTVTASWLRERTFLEFPTKLVTASLGLASLIMAFCTRDSHVGILSLTRLAVLERYLECNHDLGYLLHPTQITVGEGEAAREYGALLTSFDLLILAALLHSLVLKRIKIFTPYFPGDLWLLAVALLCPISIPCMQTLFLTSAPMRWTLAGIILVLYYILLGGFILMSRQDEKNVRFSRLRQRWEHLWDPSFMPRWSAFFLPFKPRRRSAFAVELLVTIILCGFSASGTTTPGPQGCHIKTIAGSSLIAVEAFFLVISRPFADWMQLRLVLLYRLSELAVAYAAVINAQQDTPDGLPVIIGQGFIMFGSLVVFVKSLVTTAKTIMGKRPLPVRDGLVVPSEEELEQELKAREQKAEGEGEAEGKQGEGKGPGGAPEGKEEAKKKKKKAAEVPGPAGDSSTEGEKMPAPSVAAADSETRAQHGASPNAGRAVLGTPSEMEESPRAHSPSGAGGQLHTDFGSMYRDIPYTESIVFPDHEETSLAAPLLSRQQELAHQQHGTVTADPSPRVDLHSSPTLNRPQSFAMPMRVPSLARLQRENSRSPWRGRLSFESSQPQHQSDLETDVSTLPEDYHFL